MDDETRRRLTASRAGYVELRPRVEAGEPWPLATAFGTEPEADWGPREILSHVAEMLPYWLGEWERVQAGADGDGPVMFGRQASDPLRIGVIGRDRTLPVRELFGRIDGAIGRWLDRLAEGFDGTARGMHVSLGELSADDIAERFVTSHLEDHVRQLGDALARPR
jgi:hypothetical protein